MRNGTGISKTNSIPSGYTIVNGAMTADTRRVYFAAAHAIQPKMLIYDMEGVWQEAAEFNIHALTLGQSFDAIAHDAENLYLVLNSPGLGTITDVYPYSKLGTAGVSRLKISQTTAHLKWFGARYF